MQRVALSVLKTWQRQGRWFATLLALLAAVPCALHAAERADSTILLRELQVTATDAQPLSHRSVRRTELGALLIESNLTQSLSELLSDNTVLYIKQTARGGLATSSFRGTSSGQTQVAWNGVIINSPTMGSFDFSQIPAFFTDRIAIHHGMNATAYSSGALGGSILLGNRSCLNEPLSVRVLSEYGANNTLSEGIAVGQGNSTVGWRTRLFYQQSDNDYRYLNKDLAHEAFYERRANAQYRNYGVMQEVSWQPNEAFALESNIWYMGGHRSLPQPTTVVVNKQEEQLTNNLKWLTSASGKWNDYVLHATLGLLYDQLDYRMRWLNGTGKKQENNRTASVVASADISRTFRHYTATLQLSHRYDNALSDNFSEPNLRQHASIARITNAWEWKRIGATLDAAIEHNGGTTIPTITAGANAELIPQLLTLKGCAGYNHRFPSLNDRYWNPGGNPNLRPEKGFSADVGMGLHHRFGRHYLSAEVTYYDMLIDDWIAWLPSGTHYYWTPQNVRKTRSNGVEVQSNYSVTIGKFYHKLTANYAYARSINKSSDASSASSYGKQLPYIPRHKATLRLRSHYNGWMVSYGVAFTDRRFTTADESYFTPAYTLHDVELSYSRAVWKCKEASIKWRIDNLWNEYYESTQYYPMPLRSFNVAISLRF